MLPPADTVTLPIPPSSALCPPPPFSLSPSLSSFSGRLHAWWTRHASDRACSPSAVRILPVEGGKAQERAYRRKMSPQQSGGRFPRDERNRTCQGFAHGGESERDGEAENKRGRKESKRRAAGSPGKNERIRLLLCRQVAVWIFSLPLVRILS